MPIRLHGPAPDVRLNANGLAMLLPVNGRVAALRLDARTLKHGDPQTDPNVPPPNRGDLPHLLTANAGDGWLVVATTFHSPFYRTDLYRIGKDGSVARVLPPGTDPKPATSGHGTVYPAGEGFDFSNADYLIPGFRNGPLLLGLHRNTDRTRRTPGDLEVAIIGPDGHPKGAPVPQDPSLPTSPIQAGVGLADGWLLAVHTEPRLMNPWAHGPETLSVIRITANGSGTLVDEWTLQKDSDRIVVAGKLQFVSEGDTILLLRAGADGVFAQRIGPDGKRIGSEVRVDDRTGKPDRDPNSESWKSAAGDLLGADLMSGRLRLALTEPVRLVEAIPTSGRPGTVRWTCRRDVGAGAAVFGDGGTYLFWSFGVRPPPYLTWIPER